MVYSKVICYKEQQDAEQRRIYTATTMFVISPPEMMVVLGIVVNPANKSCSAAIFIPIRVVPLS